MLRFYVDHNVHSGITAGLRRRGIDCLTALEDAMPDADDKVLLDRATALGRCMLSQDADMLAITHDRLAKGVTFAGLFFWHPLTASIGDVVKDVELAARVLDPTEMRDQIEYLPL